MRISADLLEQIVAHAQQEPTVEVCGVVAVESEGPPTAVRVHRAVNVHASALKFEIDPRELLKLYSAIEDDGHELGAIYHSHVRSEPYPSQTDINFAASWPGVEWIIVGLAAGQEPAVRSYLIEGSDVEAVTIELVPSGERQLLARKIKPQYTEGRLVKVAYATHQAEAELIQGILIEEGIPSMLRRARGFDVPDMLAAGPRDILVPESGAQAAREALTPLRD